jgi:hypothetical protein
VEFSSTLAHHSTRIEAPRWREFFCQGLALLRISLVQFRSFTRLCSESDNVEHENEGLEIRIYLLGGQFVVDQHHTTYLMPGARMKDF